MTTTDPIPEPPQPEGISLDELAQAFAQVMGTAPKLKPPVPSPDAGSDNQTAPAGQEEEAQGSDQVPVSELAAGADPCPISPRTILEAMLFVGDGENRPLSTARAAELMRGVEAAEIPGLIDELNRRYAAGGCPYHVIHEGEGYRMVLRKPFHDLRDRFHGRIRQARLSQAAVDILAIVAYQQPLTAEEIGTLRGKPSGHVLAQLVRRGLLRIERKPGKGRVAQYFTTDRFLQFFGMETLADLPQSEELERQ
jgi:segregation and condensation protein B